MFALEHPDYAAILIGFFLLVAFPVHEFAHALAAHLLGDRTPQAHGKLTLNPISHFHPLGGLILILSVVVAGMPFGFAATPINPANLRGRHGEAVVAAAGPLSNVAMALAFGLVARVLSDNMDLVAGTPRLFELLSLIVYGNIVLGIFNFLPVPPLDGSAILLSFLPRETRWKVEPQFAQYGMLLLLVVVMFGGQVIGPVAEAIFHVVVGY